MHKRVWHFAAVFFAVLVPIPSGLAQTGPARTYNPFTNVKAQTGKESQSIAPSFWIEFEPLGNWAHEVPTTGKPESLWGILQDNINNRSWDCRDPRNYGVEVNNKPLITRSVSFRTKNLVEITTCRGLSDYIKAQGLDMDLTIILYVVENRSLWQSIGGSISSVEMKNLKYNDTNGTDVKELKGDATAGDPSPDITWKETVVTVSAQTVNNEKLTDKTIYKNTVYQIPVSSTLPIFSRSVGGLFVETKDLFSTNERDSKSAFMGGLGYQVGLDPWWTIPLKIEQQVTGNQVATNLSAVTSAQVSATLPWTSRLTPGIPSAADPFPKGNTAKASLYWSAMDTAPSVTVAFPYTHRINQVVAPKSSPLPVDDFAVNPSIALTNERLLEFPAKESSKPPPFTTQWEANWGMYYLPLEKTSKGTQRAEGTGDVSILIPLSNFQIFRGMTLDPKTQTNQMQLRIKWQDSVNATNNYVRTKGWTFGLELIVKK